MFNTVSDLSLGRKDYGSWRPGSRVCRESTTPSPGDLVTVVPKIKPLG